LSRGLGDDPLSRRRKRNNGRPLASDAPSSPVAISYGTPPVQSPSPAQPIPETLPSQQTSSSYNDVFFQRRSEDEPGTTTNTSTGVPSQGSAGPLVQPTEATEPRGLPVTAVSAGAEDSPQLQVRDAVPAETHPIPAETVTLPNENAGEKSKAEERGFFKRIFGRLGQQKNH